MQVYLLLFWLVKQYQYNWQIINCVHITKIEAMIQNKETQSHSHLNDLINSPHKLLFQQKQTILPEEHDCTLINYLGARIDMPGKIILTDFRCIFKANIQSLYQDEKIRFDFPIGYIARCESSSENVNKSLVFYIQLGLKFGFVIKVKSNSANLFKISEHINSVLNQYDSFGQRRAQDLDPSEKCRKWEEVQFQGTVDEAAVYDNQAWKFLPMYPQIFKVPKPFVGKRNQHDRIVMLSYVHEGKKKTGLWKSGPGKPDNDQTTWVPVASKRQDHIVVQIKTKMVGSNKSLAEQMIEMDGPVQLRQSFMKFFISSCYENEQQQQQQKWLINTNFSKWYEQTEILISQAFLLLQKICDGVNVTILSDWDARGSQICSLVQVLAKPQNRTIAGFGKLVQRQFCHFGNFVPQAVKKQRQQDKGLALIQFLECVYQITKMYPLSFQFNEDMLAYIAIHVYSRKYGNFLYMTRATTELNQQKFVKYGSIWAKVEKCKNQFSNPYFVSHKECDIYELKKNVGMKNYRMWGSFFLRDIFMYSNNIEMNSLNANQRQLLAKHWAIKNETEVLRSKLSEQHKMITEKRKRLKELQKMQLD